MLLELQKNGLKWKEDKDSNEVSGSKKYVRERVEEIKNLKMSVANPIFKRSENGLGEKYKMEN